MLDVFMEINKDVRRVSNTISTNWTKGPSFSWSYGSWIYNYICNQCLSPLTLWIRTLFMARCTRYNIMW